MKIQFDWDQHGTFDERSSCWVRVSQAWAGAGWGAVHIPRIGQEVMVEFLDGVLDRPIITGRVYNDFNRPPYGLPTNATQSGIKSHTPEGGKDDYNELRFEDRKTEEEIVLRAQRNLTTRVRHDSNTTVSHDHQHHVKHDMTVKVSEGKYDTFVDKGPMYTKVSKAEYQLQAQRITEDAEDDIEIFVHGCKLRIDAKGIELSAMGNKITLDASGIVINGTMVRIN